MGHWYAKDGTPTYEVPNASKGGLRPTTLTDAKKLHLVPSVTTILEVPDKPALLRWKTEQVLKAAWENVRTEMSTFDDWKRQIMYTSESVGREAATRGHEIHDALEQFYLGGDLQLKDLEFIAPVVAAMNERFPGVKWVPESSFTSIQHGFGGRIDMYSPEGIVLDFKTKNTDDVKKMVAFEGHHMQTAAYAVGLLENDRFDSVEIDKVRRYNLFISTQQPGLITITESKEFDKDWEMFSTLNRYWQLKNNYKPGG